MKSDRYENVAPYVESCRNFKSLQIDYIGQGIERKILFLEKYERICTVLPKHQRKVNFPISEVKHECDKGPILGHV